MSNRGKTVISCTLYINNILCVKIDLSNPKHLHSKQYIYIYIERERESTNRLGLSMGWGRPTPWNSYQDGPTSGLTH